jgi:hypothetical protein
MTAVAPTQTQVDEFDELINGNTAKSVNDTIDKDTTIRYVHTFLNDILTNDKGLSVGFNHVMIKRLTLTPVKSNTKVKIIESGESKNYNAFGDITDVNQRKMIINGEMKTVAANVDFVPVMPDQIIKELVVSYHQNGLTELPALKTNVDNRSTEGVARSKKIYELVMSGLKETTLLQDMPKYFGFSVDGFPTRNGDKPATEIVSDALDKGTITADEAVIALELIGQLAGNLGHAIFLATNPNDGTLTRTRESMSKSKNGQLNEKTNYDNNDLWLMKQFPSFRMDTDVVQMAEAVSAAVKNNSPNTQSAMQSEVQTNEMLSMMERMQAHMDVHDEEIARLRANDKQAAESLPETVTIDNVELKVIGKGSFGRLKVESPDGTQKEVQPPK